MGNKKITKKKVIELNEKIKNRLNELGLTEFRFTHFHGNHSRDYEDIDFNLDIEFADNYDIEFRYWIAVTPLNYDICIDLRAIKLVGNTIQYWLEYYTETYKGSFDEEVYFIEFEELLDMDFYENYKNIHSLLNTILHSLEEDDEYELIQANKEYFG